MSCVLTVLPCWCTLAPQIATVTPLTGPLPGNNQVTIEGELGDGTDITSVTLAGVPALIRSQTAAQVVVTAQPSPVPAAGPVVVTSTSRGVATSAAVYTYAPTGVISSLVPDAGSLQGQTVVTVLGSELGSGTDVTSVTFGGVPATIQSQTANDLVVVTGAGTQPLVGFRCAQ